MCILVGSKSRNKDTYKGVCVSLYAMIQIGKMMWIQETRRNPKTETNILNHANNKI